MGILDCDPGQCVPRANVDDAVVIAVLAGLRPERYINQIVTVFGNTPAEIGYDCARQLLGVLGFEVAVRCGALAPQAGNADYWAHRLHHPAVPVAPRPDVELSRYCDADVIAIGPLTNIAHALGAGYSPRHVYLMGGALQGDLIDTNCAVDPLAAHAVISSTVPLTVVPLDVTRTTCLSAERWGRVYHELGRTNATVADSLNAWVQPWIEYSRRTRPVNGMWVHDLVALVAYLIDCGVVDASVISTESARLGADRCTGKLRHCDDGWTIRLVTAVDNERLIEVMESALLAL
ncbi:MAG: nucleoside hydrolase [Actinomycetaceae bacterium]|nr:nucleoside hydrolase [Actinomycetaceae bacterium]